MFWNYHSCFLKNGYYILRQEGIVYLLFLCIWQFAAESFQAALGGACHQEMELPTEYQQRSCLMTELPDIMEISQTCSNSHIFICFKQQSDSFDILATHSLMQSCIPVFTCHSCYLFNFVILS